MRVEDTIERIERFPKLRLNVISRMYRWQEDREKDAVRKGSEGARKARSLLRDHAQNDERRKEELL